jgi:hypothetical protein
VDFESVAKVARSSLKSVSSETVGRPYPVKREPFKALEYAQGEEMARTEKEITAAVARAVVNHGPAEILEAAKGHEESGRNARNTEACANHAGQQFAGDQGIHAAGEADFHEEVARRLRSLAALGG